MDEEEEGLTSDDIVRLGRQLFGWEPDYYPESSSEFEQIYEALVIELRAALRDRDHRVAQLEAELARLRSLLGQRSSDT